MKGLLKKIVGERTVDLIADGFRGRPDTDLSGYAGSRGLAYRGQTSQMGYLAAFTWAPELQWNVMRGVLPGGERGVLLHEVKVLDPDAPGTFYGKKSGPAGGIKMTDFIPGSELVNTGWDFFKCPHTTAAVRIPEATGLLHGLFVARRSERYRAGDGDVWRRRDLREFDIEGWAAVVRKRADADVADQVLSWPVHDVLSAPHEHGFTIEFMYGQLVVFQQHFLEEPEELDAFCGLVSRLARTIREICERSLRPQPWDAELPPPEWLDFVAGRPYERHILAPQGAWLERIVHVARERGLAVENPLDFHQAFPRLPVPGEAFGVLRGDDIRLLCCVERSIRDISALNDAFEDVGGPVGCNVAVLPAPGAADTEGGVDGVKTDWGRYAIKDGLLAAWMRRDAWQVEGEPLDDLAARARALRDAVAA